MRKSEGGMGKAVSAGEDDDGNDFDSACVQSFEVQDLFNYVLISPCST